MGKSIKVSCSLINYYEECDGVACWLAVTARLRNYGIQNKGEPTSAIGRIETDSALVDVTTLVEPGGAHKSPQGRRR